MQQQPRITTLPQQKLVGKRLTMSLDTNQTFELFRSFMPRRKEIKNRINQDVLCVQIYDDALNFKDFNTATVFEKWAAVAVTRFEDIPAQMETHIIPEGLYAVFTYKGNSADFKDMFYYIFWQWLPNSAYELDKRAHFQLLGEKYIRDHPESEEEVWVPVKKR